jgi:hypothetical protein
VVLAATAALVVVTGAALAVPRTAPAGSPASTLVVPGFSIGGVSLGMTRANVQRARPLGGLAKTTVHGAVISQIYGKLSAGGPFMEVVYAGKTPAARVILVGSGTGSWHTSTGARYGEPPLQVAARIRCVNFYDHKPDGSRDYDAPEGEALICEKVFSPHNYFYASFNASKLPTKIPATLSGFSISSRRIP